VSLMQLEVETFEADNLPQDLASIPAVKPASKLTYYFAPVEA